MARAIISETLTEACVDFAALRKTLHMATSIRGAERTALTHALYCHTCRPIADDLRRAQADEITRLEAGES